MSLNKKYCNACNHQCHCIGQGYFVNSNKCEVCICEHCDCGPVILGASSKKPWWKKCIDWLLA